MIDEAGRRLIEARNGLGVSKQVTSEDVQLLARMQTNRQARAVLGVIAQYLRRGYQAAENLISRPGHGDLRKAMTSRLDYINSYAQKTYAGIPDDSAALTALNHKKVSTTLQQAHKALLDISADVDEMNRGMVLGRIDDMVKAIVKLLESQIPTWLKPDDPKVVRYAVYAGLSLAALIGLYIAGKLVTKIVLRGAGAVHRGALGAAESAAVALMDAQRRRRRAGRHRS